MEKNKSVLHSSISVIAVIGFDSHTWTLFEKQTNIQRSYCKRLTSHKNRNRFVYMLLDDSLFRHFHHEPSFRWQFSSESPSNWDTSCASLGVTWCANKSEDDEIWIDWLPRKNWIGRCDIDAFRPLFCCAFIQRAKIYLGWKITKYQSNWWFLPYASTKLSKNMFKWSRKSLLARNTKRKNISIKLTQ